MKFTDNVGDSSIDPTHLRTFLEKWYAPSDIISVVAIPITGHRNVLSFAETAENLYSYDEEQIFELTYMPETSQNFNVYIGINPLIEDHKVTLKSRGSKEDVARIYGTFIDFDLKDGTFESKKEIKDFLDSMEIKPTIIVDNGMNGGVHAYWRLKDEDVIEFPTYEDEKLLVKWWAYITELTGKKIDRLIDTTRISRMPSGIYWPKDDDSMLDTVKIVSANGPRHSLSTLLEASEAAYSTHEQKRVELRRQVRKNAVEWNKRVDDYSDVAKTRWGLKDHQTRWAYAMADVRLEEYYSWEEILEPHGWTYLKDNADGSKTFARPGRDERSAVVDYTHEDGQRSGVMSLLSTSEDTRLFDLKEAGIPLTKKQVMLRLWFDDNVPQMVDYLLDKIYGLDFGDKAPLD